MKVIYPGRGSVSRLELLFARVIGGHSPLQQRSQPPVDLVYGESVKFTQA